MPKKKKIDIGALVELSKTGDTEAFGQIYDELVKPIYRYIYYRVEGKEVAEDLTEETFLKVWQNLKKYRKGKHPFSAWVFRIAHNLVMDYYRKHEAVFKIHENFADTKAFSDPKYSVEVKINEIHLKKAIHKLPSACQQVIVMKYINELDNREIAVAIGKSEGAVRTIQFRALKQLRSILEKKRSNF